MTGGDNGWGEYSKLVLKELETLATGINQLQIQIQELKQEIIEIRAREDKIHEIAQWKKRIDEIASPTQLKDLQREVNELKQFKTKAITAFVVVQFLMGVVMGLMKYF